MRVRGVSMSREVFEEALRKSGGNVQQLANLLSTDRKQVYRWLKRFGLSLEDFRA